MGEFENKNERQLFFNQIKGVIDEFNDGEIFCSLVLKVGHETTRPVNFVVKKPNFDIINKNYKLGDKVCVKFYITSKNKNGRWYTMANALEVSTDQES